MFSKEFTGKDSLNWLRHNGVDSFVIVSPGDKLPTHKEWNTKEGSLTAAQAAEVLELDENMNVGIVAHSPIVIYETDKDFQSKLGILNGSSHTVKIIRDGKPEGGALIFRVVDRNVRTQSVKREGKSPDDEIKAVNQNGTAAYKLVVGDNSGDEYKLIDTHFGIKEITYDEFSEIWESLGWELKKDSPKKTVNHRNTPSTSNGVVDELRAITPYQVFEKFGYTADGVEDYDRNNYRILSNGGLIVGKPGTEKQYAWFNFSEDEGGDVFDAWAKCARLDVQSDFKTIIKEMSAAFGIEPEIDNQSINEVLEALAEQKPDTSDAYIMAQGPHDHGNALCIQHLNHGRFAYCDSFGWMARNSTHYERENAQYMVNNAITEGLMYRRGVAVMEMEESIVKATQPTTARKNAVRDAFRDISIVSVNDFDSDPDLLNCKNGVVDLRTGKLLTHEQSGMFTYCLPIDYKPNLDATLWKNFLSTSLGDFENMHDWLQTAVGYSVTGHTSEECMFYIYGPSRSGKGTFTNALLKMVGDTLGRGVKFSMFTQNRNVDYQGFAFAPLKACRLIAASESGKYSSMDEATVKTITGGDSIEAAFKGKDSFSYFPQFKIWLSSNHPVKGDVDDDAFWYRVKVICFPNSMIGQEDKTLKDLMVTPESLSEILSWAVQGAVRWKESPTGLSMPQSVIDATQSQRDALDDVQQWLDQCTENEDGTFVSNKAIRSSYQSWCEENGYKPKLARTLTIALGNKKYSQGREYVGPQQHRGFYNLKIVDDFSI